MSTMLDAALAYAAKGKAVFPLSPGTKLPMAGSHGFKDATIDAKQITQWWTAHPDANIGLATGEINGITVLDEDRNPAKGKRGAETMFALTVEHGPLPPTLQQHTWSGGKQYFFEYDKRVPNRAKAGDLLDIDTRNDGGYVVAPPSIVSEGEQTGTYQWGEKTPAAPMPEWLVTVLTKGQPGSNGAASKRPDAQWAQVIKGVSQGSRQDELPRVAGKYYQAFAHDFVLARQSVHNWAAACEPPLTAKEVDACCDRIEAKEAAKPEPGRVFVGSAQVSVGPEGDVIKADLPTGLNLMSYEFSDWGNAERLLACYSDRIRFSAAIGWIIWDGKRWKTMMHSPKGDHLAVMQLAIKAIRAFKEQTLDIPDKKLAAKAFSHALASESRWRLEAMVELAKGDPRVRIEMDQLDQDAHLLNVANGTLDLRDGTLRPHDKADLLTRGIAVEYHKDAQAPTWEKFLDTIMDGNQNLVSFLQRAVGYSITGLLRDHALFLPYGIGANGKSTFLAAIHNVLGEYAQGMAPETLMSKRHEGIPNDIARLKGTRFVSAIETKRGRQFDESIVKKLTGGDQLTGRFLHKEFFDFLPTHKLWFGTNHKPVVKDTTKSIWRRLKLIPFTVVIPEPEQDTELGEKLKAEAEGILAWAVAGCRAWELAGLQTPQEVTAATEQYRQEQDSLAGFMEACLEVAPKGWATVEDIFKAYEAWALEHGGAEQEGEDKLTSREITSYLVTTYALTRGEKKVGGKSRKTLVGIRLRVSVSGVSALPLPSIGIEFQKPTGTSETKETGDWEDAELPF